MRTSMITLTKQLYSSCNTNSRTTWYSIAIAIAIINSLLFYPGLFSNDSFDQIGQALNNTYRTWHPVPLTILMHYLIPWLGIGGILIINQVLYWIFISLFCDTLIKKNYIFYIIGYFPPIFINTIAIFKDITSMACCLLGIIILALYEKTNKTQLKLLITSITFLLLGTIVRWNSFLVSSTIIFIYYILFHNKEKHTVKKATAFVFIFFGVCSLTLQGINTIYSAKKENPLPTLMLWDIAGICKFSNIHCPLPSYIEITDKKLSENWLNNYNSDTCSFCWNSGISCNLSQKYSSSILLKDWIKNIKAHPFSYLKHRWELTKGLLGLRRMVYYSHHRYDQNFQAGDIYKPNQLGLKSFLRLEKIGYFCQKIFIYHPIIWMIVSVISIPYAYTHLKRSSTKLEQIQLKCVIILASSGLVNAFSLCILAPAADYRYMLYTVISGLLSMLLVLWRYNLKTLDK